MGQTERHRTPSIFQIGQTGSNRNRRRKKSRSTNTGSHEIFATPTSDNDRQDHTINRHRRHGP
eukprot:377876-Pyramimonas_sp.AAC.1